MIVQGCSDKETGEQLRADENQFGLEGPRLKPDQNATSHQAWHDQKNRNRITRRSNGGRCGFRLLRAVDLKTSGLEPILFHPPIQGAATQAKCFGCLADVALKALQCLADQHTFNRLEAQLFEVLRLRSLRTQSEISGLYLFRSAHQHCALHGMFQFANVARPRVLRSNCSAVASIPFTVRR